MKDSSDSQFVRKNQACGSSLMLSHKLNCFSIIYSNIIEVLLYICIVFGIQLYLNSLIIHNNKNAQNWYYFSLADVLKIKAMFSSMNIPYIYLKSYHDKKVLIQACWFSYFSDYIQSLLRLWCHTTSRCSMVDKGFVNSLMQWN